MHVCTYIYTKGLIYCCPYFGWLFNLLINFKSPLGNSQKPKRAWFSCHLIHLSQDLLCSTNPPQAPVPVEALKCSATLQYFYPNKNPTSCQSCTTQLISTALGALHSLPHRWWREKRATTVSQPAAPPCMLRKASKRYFQLLSFFPSEVMKGKRSSEDQKWQDREEDFLGFQWVSVLPPQGKAWGTALPPPPEPAKEEGSEVESCVKGLSCEGEKSVWY